MILDKNELAKARYYPEKLVGTAVYTLASGTVAAPAPLDVRLFDPLLVRLTDLALSPQAGIEWELTWDQKVLRRQAAALPSDRDEPVDLAAFRQMHLDVVNTGTTTVSDYPVRYALWVYPPTLAERLHRRQTLTNDAARLADRLGLAAEVSQLGRLPIPLEVMLQREAQVLERLAFPRVLTLNAGADVLIEQVRPDGPDEALVLQAIAADRGASAADNVVLHIDRDGQVDYLTIQAWCLPGIDRPVSVWIPAVEELRVRVTAAVAQATWRVRIGVARIRLSDVWRIRWGLVARSEVPADLWDQVQGGLL